MNYRASENAASAVQVLYVINSDTIILLTQAETTESGEKKKNYILTGNWFLPNQKSAIFSSLLLWLKCFPLLCLHKKHKMLHSGHTIGLKEHVGFSIVLMLTN